jgi:Tol biopolymer transport system component
MAARGAARADALQMTPERWKRIEDLYHRVRALPAAERAAVLAAACGSDEALRHEVQSLLNEPVSDEYLAEPALVNAAHVVSEAAPPAMTGRSLGGYHLQALIGAGGMGEVYRAHDAKLGRDVAIKILSSALTSSPDRLARFEREARMLAALNHPNICAIYGLEESDGIRFLILELVEGETLAGRLSSGGSAQHGLPIDEALRIARQIAEALEAAHDKGIVHRDLKPANINITPTGVVKVLDFGLARPIDDASTPTIGDTREGVVLGTAAYMSPEQARARPLDKRTDVWSFGCVLYEMLTGRVVFVGETVSDTIGKILEREPDWSALPSATPAAIRRLLLRCLAKDPKQRLRDIGDVRIEIDAIGEVLPGAPDVTVAPLAPAKTRMTWLPWVALAALAAGVGVWEARRQVGTQEDPLANARFSLFTDWPGTEGAAAISPDGRFVAFVADRAGRFDIWLSQVGTDSFSNLTKDGPPRDSPGSGIQIRDFGFSGDGADIWFGKPGNRGNPKMLLPLTGGTPRPFLGAGTAGLSWSPDNSRLVYFNNGDGDRLFIADGTGAEAHPIVVSEEGFFKSGMHTHNPVWSPDGQWIYFVHGLDGSEDMAVWRVRPSGGSPERLTDLHVPVNFPTPLDARTLLFVARAQDRSGPWLWALDVASRATRRVNSGLEQYTSLSASRDGRRVVATVARSTVSLWSVPLLDRLAEDGDAQPYSVPTVRALAPRFGRTSLFYLSGHGAGDGLWRFQDGQASEVWKGTEGGLAEPPAVSPDGRRVAVVARRDGKKHLVIMSADGTDRRTLAASINIEGAASAGTADWSPDGTWIVTGGKDAQGSGLFKIPVDGGASVRLVAADQAINPVWSPDGKLIVYAGSFVAGTVPLLGIRPDGAPVKLPPVRSRVGGSYRFLPDSTGLVYLPREESLDFWLLDFATQKTRPLTHLSDRGRLNTFDITPDGKQIVFDRSRENSDIVLIELTK